MQYLRKHGCGSVLVWARMAESGVRKLVFIDQVMDKNLYLNILQDTLKHIAKQFRLEGRYYFVHDNDPKHKSNLIRDWLIYTVPHFLGTPPKLPNLNTIDNLCQDF